MFGLGVGYAWPVYSVVNGPSVLSWEMTQAILATIVHIHDLAHWT